MVQRPGAFPLVVSASLMMESFIGQAVWDRECPVGCLLCQSSALLPAIFYSLESTYWPHPVAKETGKCSPLWRSSHRGTRGCGTQQLKIFGSNTSIRYHNCHVPILTNETRTSGYLHYCKCPGDSGTKLPETGHRTCGERSFRDCISSNAIIP